jgi:SAM-dependent methyltransferase
MNLRDPLYRLSGKLQRRITPGLQYSQAVFEERLRTLVAGARSWLDLGCGHRLLPEWREEAEVDLIRRVPFVIGLDVDEQAILRHRSIDQRCLGDIGCLPFADGSFDLVTANMVVEHLVDPTVQFAEVGRVLAPGGRFVFHTPNADSYIVRLLRALPSRVKRTLARISEGRPSVDVYPTFYRANDKTSIEAAGARAGLGLASIEFVTSAPAFSLLPPLLVVELLWIRQLQHRPTLAPLRPTIICCLKRAEDTAALRASGE